MEDYIKWPEQDSNPYHLVYNVNTNICAMQPSISKMLLLFFVYAMGSDAAAVVIQVFAFVAIVPVVDAYLGAVADAVASVTVSVVLAAVAAAVAAESSGN